MRAVRKDYFLDHDHSAYVDQWDWEQVITEKERNLDYLTDVVQEDLEGAEGRRDARPGELPQAQDRPGTPTCPRS